MLNVLLDLLLFLEGLWSLASLESWKQKNFFRFPLCLMSSINRFFLSFVHIKGDIFSHSRTENEMRSSPLFPPCNLWPRFTYQPDLENFFCDQSSWQKGGKWCHDNLNLENNIQLKKEEEGTMSHKFVTPVTVSYFLFLVIYISFFN